MSIHRTRLPLAAIAAVLLSGGALSVRSAAAPAPQQAPPAKAGPAAPQPRPKTDPKWESFASWVSGLFAWGPGETVVEEVTAVKVRGYHLLKAAKFYTDERANDQAFALVDDAGRIAIIGDPFLDEMRMKAPSPLRTDSDLAGLRDQLQKFLRGRSRLVLDPSSDRPGLKGVRVLVDSGYGPYELSGFVSADDGALLVVGRAWDRKRTFPEQRKEAIKLAGTPFLGPADATVTVVEFSDMQCGFCKKRTADWEPLLAKLGASLKIRRYFKSFPLVNDHPWAFRASAAGRCFFEKDPAMFFRWKSNVYSRQESLTVSDLDLFALDFAGANDVGEAYFKGCYLSEPIASRVLSDLTEGFGIRVRATPTYFIDGVAVSWFADPLMEDFLRQTYLKGAAAAPAKGAAAGKKGGQ